MSLHQYIVIFYRIKQKFNSKEGIYIEVRCIIKPKRDFKLVHIPIRPLYKNVL